ncbi:MAG: cysteine desulfurase-like protein [Woeseiaceae bacterium]|nr:cysteine desulfurase-like protein [Woeseiaceae bacterium]
MIDLDRIRAEFPALAATDDGRPRIYFDNPAGTQVPRRVVAAMHDCLLEANANIGGYFVTSERATAVAADARAALADFLNAPSPDEIIFGQNMTSLAFHLARSLGRHFTAGDEIIVSRMDHDANIQPWVLMARDHDLEVRWLPFDPATFEFDLEALDGLLSDRTRLVCVGGASNLTGTINDIDAICAKARAAGAWTFIDAVQSAPHLPSDVQRTGCDFFACSAYKFFGPHQGVLWGRREVLEQLTPYRVRPAPAELPWCFETGTQSHEGMAGTAAAVEYFEWVGRDLAGAGADASRTAAVHAAFDYLFEHEVELTRRLIDGLEALPGVTIWGISARDALERRVSTVSFTHDRRHPDRIAEALAQRNIFAWSGHNYALEVVRTLGLLESGGTVRIGVVHYNTPGEVDALLNALEDILGAGPRTA